MTATTPASFQIDSNACAMRAYVLGMLSTDPHTHRAQSWRPELANVLTQIREEIRVSEGGGGMCHLIAEALWDQFGWARLPVSYLDSDGHVICAGHRICALPDGSLLDATADQFGEGHSVRVVTPHHPDYGRYRPEFDDEINPSTYPDSFGGFFWSGEGDHAAQDRLSHERGHGWWLKDKSAYIAYLRHQVEIGCHDFQPILAAISSSTPEDHQHNPSPTY